MSLLVVVLVLIAIGVLLGLIKKMPIMDETTKGILWWVVIAATVVWLLKISGVWTYLASVSF
jgi:VIT1/CCC1 family predicted Fe2+/Mn2+ transporter